MSQQSPEAFGAYQKARQLFDLVVGDLSQLERTPACSRLFGQQFASAGCTFDEMQRFLKK